MERKDFIRKGLLGTAMFVGSSALGGILKNDVDELKELEPVGFNHLPPADSKIAPNTVLHRANTRGHANHGWLDTHHTFSFASYYNPDRMHFGVLRVLNDDRVDPAMGFGTHPHDNMEIISIPLDGDLEHKDSMGNVAIIKHGDVQVMSAGTGIYHSEFNKNSDRPVKFLQIWLFPNKSSVTPRYGQVTLNVADRHNRLQQIVSPNADDEGVWIHQDAWFHIGRLDKDMELEHRLKNAANGVYAFVLKGDFTIADTALNERDGLGIWDTKAVSVKATSADAEILLMEVPMMVS